MLWCFGARIAGALQVPDIVTEAISEKTFVHRLVRLRALNKSADKSFFRYGLCDDLFSPQHMRCAADVVLVCSLQFKIQI